MESYVHIYIRVGQISKVFISIPGFYRRVTNRYEINPSELCDKNLRDDPLEIIFRLLVRYSFFFFIIPFNDIFIFYNVVIREMLI